MKKIILTMTEEKKYEIIKNLVKNCGNKKRASVVLNCSLRTINRLIIKFKTKGKKSFMHGNRNSKSKAKNELIKETIINMYQQYQYNESNFTHFNELIKVNHHINVSYTFVYQTLSQAGILSPKCWRITKRNKAKIAREQQKMVTNSKIKNQTTEQTATSINEMIIKSTREIPNSLAHPRKPRKKYFGEQIQMDASNHCWIAGEKWHLHLAIDDATSKIVAAYFTKEETLFGYYQVLAQILTNYGIPYEIKTDNRMIFNNNQKEKENPSHKNYEKDSHTQFAYACKQLGIELTITSIAQEKGRVERCFGTLQSRLTTEIKIANIKTIEAANKFLKTYIVKYNKHFALHVNLNTSVFSEQPKAEIINQTLAILSSRKIDNGCGIKYQNKYYQPYKNNQIATFRSKTDCLVIECFNKELLASIEDKIYELRELNKHQAISRNFDLTKTKAKLRAEKEKYRPPMTHPWKHQSWKDYVNSQKYRNKNKPNV